VPNPPGELSSAGVDAALSPDELVQLLGIELVHRIVKDDQYWNRRSSQSRPLLSTSCQRHTERPRFLIGRSKGPLEFARDHTCLCLLSREGLQGPHIFLRPRPQLRSLLRHFRSPCTNVANESAATLKRPDYPCPRMICAPSKVKQHRSSIYACCHLPRRIQNIQGSSFPVGRRLPITVWVTAVGPSAGPKVCCCGKKEAPIPEKLGIGAQVQVNVSHNRSLVASGGQPDAENVPTKTKSSWQIDPAIQ
jgi:hypothetical protein